jgi:hypothetical protein
LLLNIFLQRRNPRLQIKLDELCILKISLLFVHSFLDLLEFGFRAGYGLLGLPNGSISGS